MESTGIKTVVVQIADVQNSREAGKTLADALEKENLKNVLIISDGRKVHGSELVRV